MVLHKKKKDLQSVKLFQLIFHRMRVKSWFIKAIQYNIGL